LKTSPGQQVASTIIAFGLLLIPRRSFAEVGQKQHAAVIMSIKKSKVYFVKNASL
jgi:phage regulator Rha-like protein